MAAEPLSQVVATLTITSLYNVQAIIPAVLQCPCRVPQLWRWEVFQESWCWRVWWQCSGVWHSSRHIQVLPPVHQTWNAGVLVCMRGRELSGTLVKGKCYICIYIYIWTVYWHNIKQKYVIHNMKRLLWFMYICRILLSVGMTWWWNTTPNSWTTLAISSIGM